jgi:hypothetical protein
MRGRIASADVPAETAQGVVVVDLRFVAGGEPLGDAVGQMHAVTPWTRIVVGPGRPGAFDTSSPRLGGQSGYGCSSRMRSRSTMPICCRTIARSCSMMSGHM